MRRSTKPNPKTLTVLIAGAIAVVAGLVAFAAGAWPGLENDTLSARFSLRGAERSPSGIVIVGIDDVSFNQLKLRWPFPRRLEARVISRLHADHARAIAVDIQFTEPTDTTDDNALYQAVARARHVVLATTDVSPSGQTDVLGGEANLRAADAVAATANLPADGAGVIRSYSDKMLGITSFAAATAQAAGHPVSSQAFRHDSALIDFRGPPGTIKTVSFSKVMLGEVSPRTFAGKIVLIGATSPSLQDLHQTSSTSSFPMSGVEVQASAIWTALHDNPLGPAPGWLAVVAIVLCGGVAPLVSLRFRVAASALAAGLTVAIYLLVAQLAFDSGTVLSVSYPLAAWSLGTLGMVVAGYVVAYTERNAFRRRLRSSQLELIQRLTQAVESRDAETGEHTYRIGMLCRRLAGQLEWSKTDADMLMWASFAHDIGKIGIPDSVLLKPGRLDAEEWQLMMAHTTIGAKLLAGSDNPLLRMAETIAISHHEHWDGTGYPLGLKGEEIPLPGRICAVVDVYDALLSKRPYKEAWRIEDTLAEIERGSGSQFDPQIVAAFMALAPGLSDDLQASFSRERSVPTLRPAIAG